MGLFDKGKRKKGDEFDSPVEKIDLSAPTEALTGAGSAATSHDGDAEPAALAASPASGAGATAGVSATNAAAPSAPDDRRPVPAARAEAAAGGRERRPAAAAPRKGGYGIDDAIALMRTLPSENVELVVQVVKHTLESTRIEIGAIIEDANDKQVRIESRIKFLRSEIADLEGEIATRRSEIETLDADHRETTMVKDRLQLAERLSTRGAEAAPPRSSRPSGDYGRPKSSTQPPPMSASAASTTPPPAPGSAAAVAAAGAATPGAVAASVGSGPLSASAALPPPGGAPPPGLARPTGNTVVVKK